jgi:hypothetical protein
MIRARLEIAYSVGSDRIRVVFATAVESPNKIDEHQDRNSPPSNNVLVEYMNSTGASTYIGTTPYNKDVCALY